MAAGLFGHMSEYDATQEDWNCCPKPSEVVQLFKFHTRTRQSGESVSTYVSQLHTIAEDCKFGIHLDRMLHDDWFVG